MAHPVAHSKSRCVGADMFGEEKPIWQKTIQDSCSSLSVSVMVKSRGPELAKFV